MLRDNYILIELNVLMLGSEFVKEESEVRIMIE